MEIFFKKTQKFIAEYNNKLKLNEMSAEYWLRHFVATYYYNQMNFNCDEFNNYLEIYTIPFDFNKAIARILTEYPEFEALIESKISETKANYKKTITLEKFDPDC